MRGRMIGCQIERGMKYAHLHREKKISDGHTHVVRIVQMKNEKKSWFPHVCNMVCNFLSPREVEVYKCSN